MSHEVWNTGKYDFHRFFIFLIFFFTKKRNSITVAVLDLTFACEQVSSDLVHRHIIKPFTSWIIMSKQVNRVNIEPEILHGNWSSYWAEFSFAASLMSAQLLARCITTWPSTAKPKQIYTGGRTFSLHGLVLVSSSRLIGPLQQTCSSTRMLRIWAMAHILGRTLVQPGLAIRPHEPPYHRDVRGCSCVYNLGSITSAFFSTATTQR